MWQSRPDDLYRRTSRSSPSVSMLTTLYRPRLFGTWQISEDEVWRFYRYSRLLGSTAPALRCLGYKYASFSYHSAITDNMIGALYRKQWLITSSLVIHHRRSLSFLPLLPLPMFPSPISCLLAHPIEHTVWFLDVSFGCSKPFCNFTIRLARKYRSLLLAIHHHVVQ